MTAFYPFPRQNRPFAKEIHIPTVDEILVGIQDEMNDNEVKVLTISNIPRDESTFTRSDYLTNIKQAFQKFLMRSTQIHEGCTIRIICNSDTWNLIYECLQEGESLLKENNWNNT